MPLDASDPNGTVSIVTHGLPDVRVGPGQSRPDPHVLARLAARRTELADELRDVERDAAGTTGDDVYRLTHRRLVAERERAELALSLELNRRRAASDELVSIPDEVDPEIARLGTELNRLRIERRIYDYVVQSL